MEFRINAEDPVTFAPNPGKIREFHIPGGPGVRVDTAAYRDYVIPPHYDSLIAKLIVRGKDRAEALARARRALEQFIIEGVKTSIPLTAPSSTTSASSAATSPRGSWRSSSGESSGLVD